MTTPFHKLSFDETVALEHKDTPTVNVPPTEWLYVQRGHVGVNETYEARDTEHYITEPLPIRNLPGFFWAWRIDGGFEVTVHRDDIIHRPNPKGIHEPTS